MHLILGFFGVGLDSILAGINRKVAQLEKHASKAMQKSDAAAASAQALLLKSEERMEESYKASRVAAKVRDLIS